MSRASSKRILRAMAEVNGALQELAKQRIASGELPCPPAARTWGSHGSGAPCSLCAGMIRADQIEYEVAVVDPRGLVEPRTLRFHLPCHLAWQTECRRPSTRLAHSES